MFETVILNSRHHFKNEHFIKLLNDEISCIIIDNFYPNEECVVLYNYLISQIKEFEDYQGIDAKVYGNPLYWDNKSIQDYWAKSKEWQHKLSSIYAANDISNPVEKVVQLLSNIWRSEVIVPIDEDNQYFAGDIRIINSAGLHTDMVTRRIKTGVLGQVQKQLSWNIYLAQPTNGSGELFIFNKSFDESDVTHKKKNGFGYNGSVVKGAQSVKVVPKQGRFVIFKSSNYHRVKKVKPNDLRISITSFVGYMKMNKPLILWS